MKNAYHVKLSLYFEKGCFICLQPMCYIINIIFAKEIFSKCETLLQQIITISLDVSCLSYMAFGDANQNIIKLYSF